MPGATPRLQKPLWIVAVLLGSIYWLGALGRSGVAFESFADWPKIFVIALKASATGLLVIATWLTAKHSLYKHLTASLSIIWLADNVLALGAVQLSGFIFVVAHLVAISAYWQLRSAEKSTPAYLMMAAAIIVLGMATMVVAAQYFPISTLMLLFPIFSLISAAMALRSRFPFLTLGAGTIIFSLSDILAVFSISAPGGIAFSWIVWTSYFSGLALISWAIMRHRDDLP